MLGMFFTSVLFPYIEAVGAKFSFGLFSSSRQVCGAERINIIIPLFILQESKYYLRDPADSHCDCFSSFSVLYMAFRNVLLKMLSRIFSTSTQVPSLCVLSLVFSSNVLSTCFTLASTVERSWML